MYGVYTGQGVVVNIITQSVLGEPSMGKSSHQRHHHNQSHFPNAGRPWDPGFEYESCRNPSRVLDQLLTTALLPTRNQHELAAHRERTLRKHRNHADP